MNSNVFSNYCLLLDKSSYIKSIKFEYQYTFGYTVHPPIYSYLELVLQKISNGETIWKWQSDPLNGSSYSWDNNCYNLCGQGICGCIDGYSPLQSFIFDDLYIDYDQQYPMRFLLRFINNQKNVHILEDSLLIELTIHDSSWTTNLEKYRIIDERMDYWYEYLWYIFSINTFIN